MTLHAVVVEMHIQRAIYATRGSGLSCSYCGSRGEQLHEYTVDGDRAREIFKGLFCSDGCFQAFHHVAIAA
jgi:hypothetical protein